ncbi:hypothetical protein JHK85_007310 [Glycine max]|nr:hypothetical protein JHK85_007310 [Glycine max]KAG5071891.1 hypothetical protein JHK86_007102 [Glycine max]
MFGFQLVQPAFQFVLRHIRSRTLDKFKEAFDKALKGGEGFFVAANNCIGSCMIADIDERGIRREKPEDLVMALAKAKANATVQRLLVEGPLEEDASTTWIGGPRQVSSYRVWMTGASKGNCIHIFNALQSLKLLSVMATIRLEDDDIDNIDKVLVVALVDSSLNSNATRSMTMVASLASSS